MKEIYIVLFFGLMWVSATSAFADDISSTVRGPDSTQPGSIGSTIRGPNDIKPGALGTTVRSKTTHPDPMLSTDAQTPPDAAPTSTEYKTATDPMLSTSAKVPASDAATSSTNMKSSDPMLSTAMPTPASAAATSTAPPGVDARVCDALTKHTPRADVAYQGGVDTHGKAVAPADLAGSPQIQMPAKIQIPLTFSLAKVINLDTSKFPFNTLGPGTEGVIGNLSVEGDKVYFNNQPLSDTQQDNLAVLCLKQNGK